MSEVNHQLFSNVLAHRNAYIPSGAKVVFLIMVLLSNQQGYFSLAQRTVADICGLSERQVRKHLSLLRNLDVISKVKKASHSSTDIYDLSTYVKGGN
jgi:Fic family protein